MTQKQGQYASTDWLRVILKIMIWDAAVNDCRMCCSYKAHVWLGLWVVKAYLTHCHSHFSTDFTCRRFRDFENCLFIKMNITHFQTLLCVFAKQQCRVQTIYSHVPHNIYTTTSSVYGSRSLKCSVRLHIYNQPKVKYISPAVSTVK